MYINMLTLLSDTQQYIFALTHNNTLLPWHTATPFYPDTNSTLLPWHTPEQHIQKVFMVYAYLNIVGEIDYTTLCSLGLTFRYMFIIISQSLFQHISNQNVANVSQVDESKVHFFIFCLLPAEL